MGYAKVKGNKESKTWTSGLPKQWVLDARLSKKEKNKKRARKKEINKR